MPKKKKKKIKGLTGKGDLDLMKKDKILKLLDQTEVRKKNRSITRDKGRPAKLPGKRISEDGNIYWETRSNRSDAPLKSV